LTITDLADQPSPLNVDAFPRVPPLGLAFDLFMMLVAGAKKTLKAASIDDRRFD
jgi:hypothetical protein